MRVDSMPLAALAEVRSGGGAPQDSSAFTTSGHPFVRAGSLSKLLSGAIEDTLEHLQPKTAAEHGLRLFPSGTVLFAKSGMSATKGHVYRLRRPAYVVNHLAALIPRRPDDSAFLVRLLERCSPVVLVKDPAYPSIRLGDIEDMQVLVPPNPDDRLRIAEVLDRADALRAKRRAALAQLDTLTQSIFLDMFGDPVSNPRKWPLKKLGDPDVGSLDRGISRHRPRNAPELLGGQYPLVQTGEVANCDGYIRDHHAAYSDLGLRQSKMWPAGTLCITIAANIAKAGILTFDACFPDSVVGFRARHGATVEFVRTWLSFRQKALEESAPESAQKNINLAILRDLDIPFPPLHAQRDFAGRVAKVERTKAAHRASLTQLDALFASLQHDAFRGAL